MNKNPDEKLTPKEASKEYRVSVSYLARQRAIPMYKIGRKKLYLRRDLDHWFEQHRHETDDELRTLVDEVVSKIEKGSTDEDK